MGSGVLSIFILSCKIISLICLIVSIHPYNWFQLDTYSIDQHLIQELCISYGAFCNIEDQMPLPRLVVILPCILSIIGLLLEIIYLSLLYSIWQQVRSVLHFFLEQTSIALSLATTIHCSWVSAVHIRISMEINIIHLDWTFFAFGLATILFAIDCVSSIIRLMKNCQDEQANHNIQLNSCRHKSIVDSDI